MRINTLLPLLIALAGCAEAQTTNFTNIKATTSYITPLGSTITSSGGNNAVTGNWVYAGNITGASFVLPTGASLIDGGSGSVTLSALSGQLITFNRGIRIGGNVTFTTTPTTITSSGSMTIDAENVSTLLLEAPSGTVSILSGGNINFTGSPVFGTPVPVTGGGTGSTTASAALTALLPSQGGQSGKVLGTNGTAASWVANGGGGGTPGGSDTQVQYNASGSFGANAGFTSDTSGNVTVNSLLLPTGASILDGGSGSISITALSGQLITFTRGLRIGGNITFTTTPTTISSAGAITISTTNVSDISLTSASHAINLSGNTGVNINSGSGATAFTGAVTFGTPVPVASGGTGAATLTNHGVVVGQGTSPVHITAAGTAGQVLTSGGSGADPTWGSAGTGTVTLVGMAVPSFLSVSPSSISTSGTFTVSLSGTALPVSSGGTGATSLWSGGVVYGNGTGALQASGSLTADSSGNLGMGGNLTFSTGNGVVGGTSTTNPAGIAGHVSGVGLTSGLAISLTSGVTVNVVSHPFPAGHFLISGNVWYSQGAGTVVTTYAAALSIGSATLPGTNDAGESQTIAQITSNGTDGNLKTGPKYFTSASPFTVYEVSAANFSGGTLSTYGGMTWEQLP